MTTQVTVTITADAGGAGQTVPIFGRTKSAKLRLDESSGGIIQYQVDGGAWRSMTGGDRTSIDIDFATQSLRVRKGDGAGSPVTLMVEPLAAEASPGQLLGLNSMARKRPLTVVSWGNSISENGKYSIPAPAGTRTGWTASSHMRYLSSLAGLVFTYGSVTATTRCDSCGNYGFAGSSLGSPVSGMMQDSYTNWFPVLDAAGVVPDLVVVLAATENDITGGTSAESIIASINLWMQTLIEKWSGVRVLWYTNRPDNRLSLSAAQQVVAQQVYEYQMLLPQIFGEDRVEVADVHRTNALGDTWNIDPARCSDVVTASSGVHPNAAGAFAEAVVAYEALQRLGILREYDARFVSANLRMVGSIAAVNGVFGAGSTAPTGGLILNATTGSAAGTTGWNTTAGANTTTAENPGWLLKLAAAASPVEWLCRTAVIPSPATVVPRKLTPFVRVEIVSGGSNIVSLAAATQVTYSGGPTADHWSTGISETAIAPGYRDGDVLTLYGPLLAPQTAAFGGGGTITNIIGGWLYAGLKPNSTATIRILDAGVLSTQASPADVFA